MRKFRTLAQNPGVATQPGFCFAKSQRLRERQARPPRRQATASNPDTAVHDLQIKRLLAPEAALTLLLECTTPAHELRSTKVKSPLVRKSGGAA